MSGTGDSTSVDRSAGMDLRGKRVVVTGGSQGIGAAIAHECAERGAHVLVVARSEDRLRTVAARLVGDYVVADLTDPDDVDSLVARCIDTLGHIDVWVNNAGLETSTSFAAADRDEIRQVARLNFESSVLLTRDVLDHMLPRGTGHIVQMASVAAAIPFPGLAVYAGTKAGLTNFSESLRLELKGTGIGLTVVSPGPVETEMWERLEHDEKPFTAVGLRRFKQVGFLPKLSAEQVAVGTVNGIVAGKRFVRLPLRYNGYHYLANTPRRLVEAVLVGTKFPQDWDEQEATR
jgi:short-subunit dehydrogenase